MGLETAPSASPTARSLRGWTWTARPGTWTGADEDWELTARDDRGLARICREGDGYWVARPGMIPEPPIEPLEAAMRRAERVALSALRTKMPKPPQALAALDTSRNSEWSGVRSDWRPSGDGADMPDLPEFLRRALVRETPGTTFAEPAP